MNKIIIILLFIFIYTKSTKAEVLYIDLNQSIKLALANNKTILEEPKYNLKIKTLARKSAYKDFMPQFKIGLLKDKTRRKAKTEIWKVKEEKQDDYEIGSGLYWNYIFNNGLKFNSEAKNILLYNQISQKYQSTLQTSIEFLLPLTEGQRLSNLLALKEADEAYQLTQIEYELAQQRLILECIEKYFTLCKAYKNVKLAEEQLNLTKELLKLTEAKFKLGEISEVEKMQGEVELAIHEDELSQALAQKESTLREFLKILGLPKENEIIIDEQLLSLPEIKYKLDEAIKEAINNRLEIKAQEIILSSQKRNVIITKAKNKPNISLISEYKLSSNEEKEFGQAIKKYPDKSWGIKFMLTYPFFDSQKTKTEIQKEEINYESALASLKRLKENIEDEIFLIYNELESLRHRLKNLELNLKLAEQTLKINQMKYKLGKTSSREVKESQLSYFKVKSHYEDGRVDFIINYMRLLKAMGKNLANGHTILGLRQAPFPAPDLIEGCQEQVPEPIRNRFNRARLQLLVLDLIEKRSL